MVNMSVLNRWTALRVNPRTDHTTILSPFRLSSVAPRLIRKLKTAHFSQGRTPAANRQRAVTLNDVSRRIVRGRTSLDNAKAINAGNNQNALGTTVSEFDLVPTTSPSLNVSAPTIAVFWNTPALYLDGKLEAIIKHADLSAASRTLIYCALN